jgi:heme exporter protein C
MSRGARALALAGLVAFLLDLSLALRVAPPAAGFSAPLTQRIFYVHVPAAVAAYAAFTLTTAAGLRYLQRREPRWDRVAASAAEVGVVLTTVALFTGVVWSRVEFFSAGGAQEGFAFALLGDAKFVTTAALWLVFLGYLALRRGVDGEEARARLSAVYGALGFLAVPMSYLSSRFSPHPDFLARGSGLAPELAWLLLAATLCWLVIFAALFANRLALEERQAARAEALPAAPEAA